MKNQKLKLAEAMAGIAVMTIDDSFKRGEIGATASFLAMFEEAKAFKAECETFADGKAVFDGYMTMLSKLKGWKAYKGSWGGAFTHGQTKRAA